MRPASFLLALLAGALPLGIASGHAAESLDVADVESRLTPAAGSGRVSPGAVMSRGADGHATVRAFPLDEPLEVDGRLDEAIYARIPPIDDFLQQEPEEGAPATERTEAWIFFDADYVYVAGRMWDSHPERMVANEMRRDHRNLWNNENFGFVLDTFLDRRNAFFFYVNPMGGLFDGRVTDESDINRDWNTVWKARTGHFEGGWTAEIAIPFESLRYSDSGVWGLNLRRRIRWKNEVAYLAEIPASSGMRGITRISRAADLVGVHPPPPRLDLEVKPYAIAGLATDREAEIPYENDLQADLGGDLKLGLTRSLTLDVTVNTDFAQVEADEQQVNLTRFGLYFPEKREFFLEGQGLYSFGGSGGSGGRGGGGDGPAPILFFSRRIGLSDEGPVPIQAGARITGKTGDWGIGALHIRTGLDPTSLAPTTDFSVVRVKRDLFRRSSIGLIATRRAPGDDGLAINEAWGGDLNLVLGEELRLSGYAAGTRSPELEGDATSYRGRLDYGGDTWGFELDRLKVGDAFNPEVGFVSRDDFVRHQAELRFSPRPAGWDAVRKLGVVSSFENYHSGAGALETRVVRATGFLDFESSAQARLTWGDRLEVLTESFEIVEGVVIPPGEYRYQRVHAGLELPQQNRVSGWLELSSGGFYGGRRDGAWIGGRIEVSPRLSLEPRASIDRVDLPFGAFTATLAGSRVVYSFSPRAFASALVQYNSLDAALDTNVRLRWEYVPGSELFVVYSDGRLTRSDGIPGLRNRSLVVKLTRLFRF